VTLTAPSAPTFGDLAVIASRVVGHEIGLDVQGPDAWLAAQQRAGADEFSARFRLGIFEAAAGGFFAGTDPLLGKLLGREPRSVADFLAR
jgi:hypothetical protein